MGQDHMMHRLLALALLAGSVPAQEFLWEVSSSVDNYTDVYSFGDFNHDGYEDVLTRCWVNYNIPGEYLSLRILSGADGSVLYTRPIPFSTYTVVGVGDFDGDGYPDYAISWTDQGNTNHVAVWSPHRNQQILVLTVLGTEGFGGCIAGRVDLNGDGQPDLLVASTQASNPSVRAFDHSGALLYRIPFAPFNAVVLSVLGMPDVDGDGCSDFVVGGVEYSTGVSRGYVALFSGRTGSLIRVAYDERPGELIGFPLCRVGDMDRDGVQDYATGNYWGFQFAVVTVYSGATGAVVRKWSSATYGLVPPLFVGDADRDGVVDLIASTPRYLGGTGRVQVFSSRDQQMLMYMQPQPGTNYPGSTYGETMADLGVQPGSPYPVFAVWDQSNITGYGRIQAWRCTPAGVHITGDGCNSTGLPPAIGVRRVDTPAGEQSRIVLGSAPANAFAWCAVGAASETTFAGLNLPIALDPYGFAGCSLLVPATFSLARGVGASGFDRGYAEVNLPLPLVPTGGFSAAAQWIVLDPATSGFASTPRCEFRVQ